MQPSIAVVDASVGDTPAERNLRREIDAEITVYEASAGERPPSPATGRPYDGVVVSGSQTAVYDDHDWIHDLTDWLRAVHRAGVPVLGICWGHQFLAQSLGGRVVDTGEYQIGYHTAARTADDPLFDGIDETFTAFQTHSDRVAELPPGATVLARDDTGLQAFRVGDSHSYGVQFHPEYDRETAEWVIQNKGFGADREAALLAEITDETVAAAAQATRVFDNFVEIAARGGRHTDANARRDGGA